MALEIGKVPERVLKRSVFKKIASRRDEVVLSGGVGEDCTALELPEGWQYVMTTDPITGTAKDIGSLAINVTVNDLASAGAEPIGVMLTILLPPRTREIALATIMEAAEQACAQHNMQIIGGHTEITAAVNTPIVSVTGVGKVQAGHMVSTAGARPGMDIIVTKDIALEGTQIIAKEKENELLERFPAQLVDRAKAFDQEMSVLPESRIAVANGVAAMHDVTEGGIFGALWEMAEASGCGLEADLKAIPIRQETVEICEHFDVNPYYLISSGSMLMAADNGSKLVEALMSQGIKATIIGKFTDGADRVVVRDDERRFLTQPPTDELYKVV